MKAHKTCNRCVMNTSAEGIHFNEQGICNYCTAFLKKLNYLIIDCLKFKRHPGHFNLETSIRISTFLKPKKTILTNLHTELDYNFLKKNLPKNILPAYDGMRLKI